MRVAKNRNYTCSSYRISLLLRLRQDVVIRKLVGKQGINRQAACEDFVKFDV